MKLVQRATSELKIWEGRELERAYLEAPLGTKTPLVLHESGDAAGTNEWTPTDASIMPIVRRRDCAVELLPWKPADQSYEAAWFLEAPPWNNAHDEQVTP